MVSIVRATENDTELLAELSRQTFLESHGHSAGKEDIDKYVAEKYSAEVLKQELADENNIYHLLYYNNKAAGFSKIIFNSPYLHATEKNITKLERIYLLTAFHDLHLGKQLFDFNIQLMKSNNQSGVWLYVWKENQRAIQFYTKKGFVIIGSHDFKISDNHSNPNHQLLLRFE